MTRWVEGGGRGELGVGGDEKEAPQRVTVTRRESLTSGHPVGGFFWPGVGGEWGGGPGMGDEVSEKNNESTNVSFRLVSGSNRSLG